MYQVVRYERTLLVGQSIRNREEHSSGYRTRDEARKVAWEEAQKSGRNGYNPEYDYYWAHEEDAEEGFIFAIEADPIAKIM